MWSLFEDERFVQLQGICFLLLTMGLICLFAPDQKTGVVAPLAMAWLVLSVFVSAITSVINCRVLQRGSCSLHMQNMLLYSQGFIFNLAFYMSGLNATGKGMASQGFFDGYANFFVIWVLISQSFMGLVISAVYKYGDAIVKCLAAAVQSAILLVFDAMLFGYTFNIQSIMGAGIVVATTYTYFAEALPALQKAKNAEKARVDKTGEVVKQSNATRVLRGSIAMGMGAALCGLAIYVLTFYI